MSADTWERAKPVFEVASAAAPDARGAILDAACAGDDELRAEVLSLLAWHDQAEGFLETPAAEGMAAALSADADRSGGRIGPYRIVREIGRGGMGVVYLAERQDQYRQTVAIKLVRAGIGGDLARRFMTERQILANLDHPNIARLLDGGATADGWPYLVMELVEGVPLTEYCDQQRLTIPARLQLFATVCAAVHNAHQHLVIHRDLKPANILITREGVPKLLDFGIARLLDPDLAGTSLTRTGFHPMTPDYASPEQARGESVTTATDTYSLGVILYELLSGQRPYTLATAASHAALRVITETTPPLLSAAVAKAPAEVGERRGATRDKLRRLLSGDLDNIVLMAMRKEAARRYVSVAQFAEDLRLHLERRPVIARRETAAYRALRFARRNWIGVSAAALTALGLATGIVLAAASARQASQQKAIAEKRLDESRQFAISLIDSIEAVYGAKSRTAAQAQLTENVVGYLDALSRQARGDVRLQHDLARAYFRLGSVIGDPNRPSLGEPDRAFKSFEKSVQLFEALYRSDPEKLADSRELGYVDRGGELAGAYQNYAVIVLGSDVKKSLELHLLALPIREAMIERAPEERSREVAKFHVAEAYELVGERLGHPYYPNLGDTARGLEYCQRAFELRKTLDAQKANDSQPRDRGRAWVEYQFVLPDSYNLMAGMLWAAGRFEDALRHHETGLALFEKAIGDRDDIMLRDEFALRHVRWANLLIDGGRHREALPHLELARETLLSLLPRDPDNGALRRDLMRVHTSMGVVLLSRGDLARALESCRLGAKLGEAALAAGIKDPGVKERLADSYQAMANVLSKSGRSRDAMEHGRKALELRESLAAMDPANARYAYLLALNHRDEGNVLQASGNAGEATAAYRKSLAMLEPMAAGDPASWLKRRALAEVRERLGR